MLMETETPRAVPLTAASLAMLESPEYGEDPSMMLLRRVLSSPHQVGDPNAPDDGDRRHSMELDAPLAGPSGPSSASAARASPDTTGSFVAYLAPRGASAADCTRFANAFAANLGDGESCRVGARGAVAHERDGVATFVNETRNRVVLFCGALKNGAALAADVFETETDRAAAPASVSAPELIDRLYDTCGPDFVDQLEGVFALAVVDGEGAAGGSLYAAADRRGALPLLKGRCASGGVVVAHVGVGADRGGVRKMLDRAMVGGTSSVPAGTYVVGNRHSRPHRYCRSAEAERALRMLRDDVSYASLGTEAGSAPRTAGFRSRENSFGSFGDLRDVRDGADPHRGGTRAKSRELRRRSVQAPDALDYGALGAWSPQTADLGDGSGDGSGESRMGASFKEAEEARRERAAAARKGGEAEGGEGSGRDSPEPDVLSRLGSGASDQSAVKAAASVEYQNAVEVRSAKAASASSCGAEDTRGASECYVSLRG